jgi:hypothetical protein
METGMVSKLQTRDRSHPLRQHRAANRYWRLQKQKKRGRGHSSSQPNSYSHSPSRSLTETNKNRQLIIITSLPLALSKKQPIIHHWLALSNRQLINIITITGLSVSFSLAKRQSVIHHWLTFRSLKQATRHHNHHWLLPLALSQTGKRSFATGLPSRSLKQATRDS